MDVAVITITLSNRQSGKGDRELGIAVLFHPYHFGGFLVMAQQQSNSAGGGCLAVGGVFILILFIFSQFNDDKPQDATDPTWIEEQTDSIPVYREEEAALDLKIEAIDRGYDNLSKRDRELLMKEVADRNDITVNQLKASYNKHK